MDPVRIIEVKRSIYESNDREAEKLRQELKERGIFLLNLMSSPGSGKTTTLKQVIARMKDEYRIGVMEADIDSDIDARAIADTGVRAIQLHTGGMCHLDAGMTRQGLEELTAAEVDFAVLENVGNLVCPAEFDTGATKNAMILSVPEGHDKPLKYPLMFSVCDAVLINKTDVMPYFDFDLEQCRKNIALRNPKAEVFPVCAKTGEGIEAFTAWLKKEIDSNYAGVSGHTFLLQGNEFIIKEIEET
ncbi:MAG: hydrogenase nickel incorporation protein HypB [Lachnospiraceae bacterium]|nr:hydrogenase nickel incorporation protein HypB [Lachnospiraceae bacterium]